MKIPSGTSPGGGLGRGLRSRTALLLAFAFAVMADPVSSVAYAIEAALRALDGDLALLVPAMVLVVAIVALVIVNYGNSSRATREVAGRRPRWVRPSETAGPSSRSARWWWISCSLSRSASRRGPRR